MLFRAWRGWTRTSVRGLRRFLTPRKRLLALAAWANQRGLESAMTPERSGGERNRINPQVGAFSLLIGPQCSIASEYGLPSAVAPSALLRNCEGDRLRRDRLNPGHRQEQFKVVCSTGQAGKITNHRRTIIGRI